MKPWQETWTYDACDGYVRTDVDDGVELRGVFNAALTDDANDRIDELGHLAAALRKARGET